MNLSFFFDQQPHQGLGIFVISFLVLQLFHCFLIKRLSTLAKKTQTQVDDILVSSLSVLGWPFYFFLLIYLSLQFVNLALNIEQFLTALSLIIITIYLTLALQRFLTLTLEMLLKIRQNQGKDLDHTVAAFFEALIKIVIWILALVLVLQNLGFQVTALLGGLGIIGLAISFALQNVFKDFFAFFSIYFDKPFKVGDYIKVGADSGTVKKIGIKSTRLQTVAGQELIIPNQELTSVRISNYNRMTKRRVVFNFKISYDTPLKKVQQVKKIVTEIFSEISQEAINIKDSNNFRNQQPILQLNCVHFRELGDFSLNFEVVYFILSTDYQLYLDFQEKINLALMERLAKEKIELADLRRVVNKKIT